MMRIFVLTCNGNGKNDYNGKPVTSTFGVYKTQQAAREAMERLKKCGPCHFAENVEWIIHQDALQFED